MENATSKVEPADSNYSRPESDRAGRVEGLLRAGGEIAGSAIGGALGFFTGGPFGAAAAGAIGTAAGGLLADVATRLLSQRERIRVGAAAQFAYAQIQTNMDTGLRLRRDDFSRSDGGSRPPAEEIFEGMLLKAQREHEERKLRYIGQFFGNIAFDRYCSAAQSNCLLNLIARLTYQQLVMIRTFRPLDLHEVRITRWPGEEELTSWEQDLMSKRKTAQRQLRSGLPPRMRSGGVTLDWYAAYGALFELFTLSLVAHIQENGLPNRPPSSITEIDFASTSSTVICEQLHRLCGLESIPIEDVEELKHVLAYTRLRL